MDERKVDEELEEQVEQPEEEEEQKPSRYMIEEKTLIELFSQDPYWELLKYLQKAIFKKRFLEAVISKRFRNQEVDTEAMFAKLAELKMIREAVNPEEDGEVYVVLIRDFITFRRPPVEIINNIQELPLPKEIKKQYLQDVTEHFKTLKKGQIQLDPHEICKLLSQEEFSYLFAYLRENLFDLKDVPKDLKAHLGADYKTYLKTLEEKKFIKTYEDQKKGQIWVMLFSDAIIKQIFPEYLIDTVNFNLKEEKISKSFAIILLNLLKNSYYELEQPAALQNLLESLKPIREEVAELIEEQPKNFKKNLEKLKKEALQIVQKTGNLQLIKDEEEYWTNLIEKMTE